MICPICHGASSFRVRLGRGQLSVLAKCWRCKGAGTIATLNEAAADFLAEWQHSPWLVNVLIRAPDTLIVQTVYELPRALREHLATWQGWRVEFRVVGRASKEW